MPLIPDGATRVSNVVSVVRQDGKVIYLVGTQGLLCHDENDHRSFRLYTAQLIDQDACRQIDVARAFGVTKSSLARALKTLRVGGAEAFFASRRTRGASVMTPEVTARAQQLLADGWSRSETATELGLKPDTLRKAIQQGRLVELAPIQRE